MASIQKRPNAGLVIEDGVSDHAKAANGYIVSAGKWNWVTLETTMQSSRQTKGLKKLFAVNPHKRFVPN